MSKKNTVTMKDISERTGFSINTVARALKDRDDVAPESKKEILRVAEELNYISNGAASFLRTGHSRTIAVILADITNPTFSEGVREIEQMATDDKYAMMIFNTNEDKEAEKKAIRTAISKNVDGILICPCADSNENLKFLYDTDIPFVLLGRKADEKYPWVVRDDEKCGRLAARHLVCNANCKRLMMINADSEISGAAERCHGFFYELERIGLDENSYACVKTYLKDGRVEDIIKCYFENEKSFDGIYCFNDIFAMEAVNALAKIGYRVPFDVSVVGTDNLCRSFSYLMPLDSVGESGESLYCVSYRKLIRMICEEDKTELHTVLDVKLAEYGSVLKRK